MTRAISRDSFDELKNYLGVYLQQGRVILDADWNENQDIAVSFVRRLAREALGDGTPNEGFRISPAFPALTLPPLPVTSGNGGDIGQVLGQILAVCIADLIAIALDLVFGSLPFFLEFPGFLLEDFESTAGWQLSSPQGNLRLGRDRPYHGGAFLRLSGHAGTVRLTKTLPGQVDLSAFELATFRFRLNEQVPGDFKFFLVDANNNRSEWTSTNSALAADFWLSGFAAPLNLAFHVVTSDLMPAFLDKSYSGSNALSTFGGTPGTPGQGLQWTVVSGALPPGLSIVPDTDTVNNVPNTPLPTASIVGTVPAGTAKGDYHFTLSVTDHSTPAKTATRALTIRVQDPLPPGTLPPLSPGLFAPLFAQLMATRTSAPTGTPADLTRITGYGFEVYQDNATPLVWDFDFLNLGSGALQDQLASNNFIIRGDAVEQFANQVAMLTLLNSANSGGGGGTGLDLSALLNLLNSNFQLFDPSIETAGRMYVAGLPCVQIHDVLYNDQADVNDPPLTTPTGTAVRTDSVYLDVWLEPVTYVEDPQIRDVALGGPDTATRLRVKYRVRVAEGGPLPTGDGRGAGTLATEGSYAGTANRYYRVEIDRAGDIGVATMRWSEDNASTIQRVIAEIPPGSTSVTVEDASAFHPGDAIVIAKEFGSEAHTVASVFGNVISLQAPTGTQLAALPAGVRGVPGFTTFALADKPKIQRWNAVSVPIVGDPSDGTISVPIALSDGVAVRFGGRAMRAGDCWNFKTRFLAGDEATGINPVTRIESLDFARPSGVIHHYAPLALLLRDPASPDPAHITTIEDRRKKIGGATTTVTPLPDKGTIAGTGATYVGGVLVPATSQNSKFVVFVQCDLFLHAVQSATSKLTLQVSFYNDGATNPQTDPDTGKVLDRTIDVVLAKRPLNVDIPLTLLVNSADIASLIFLVPQSFTATSVHLFAKLSDTGTTVDLNNIQLSVIELKRSF